MEVKFSMSTPSVGCTGDFRSGVRKEKDKEGIAKKWMTLICLPEDQHIAAGSISPFLGLPLESKRPLLGCRRHTLLFPQRQGNLS